MTGYKNKYLEMLKAKKSKKHPGEEPSKPSKIALRSFLNNFEGFEGTQGGAFSEFSPLLDVEGMPCGLCPTCHRGEFWRWPPERRSQRRGSKVALELLGFGPF